MKLPHSLKECPVCGTMFTPTRKDQKYCKTYGNKCRNHANNSKASALRDEVKPIQAILASNRCILLKALAGQKQCNVSVEYLKGAGYNFPYYTHIRKYDDKSVNMSYEVGITPINSHTLKVINLGITG